MVTEEQKLHAALQRVSLIPLVVIVALVDASGAVVEEVVKEAPYLITGQGSIALVD